MATPQERYASLVETLLRDPEVSRSRRRGFGSSGLWVAGKVFVMLVKGELVVKLPRPRVDELVAAGQGARLETSTGKAMKEWLSVAPASTLDWLALAREAKEFVAGRR